MKLNTLLSKPHSNTVKIPRILGEIIFNRVSNDSYGIYSVLIMLDNIIVFHFIKIKYSPHKQL